MKNTNKFKKGTFEKIDEDNYKINGNEVSCKDENVKKLIPLIRDVVEQGENAVLENCNSGKSSYSITDEDGPIAEIVTKITDFLDLLFIHRKTQKNGTCYYEIENTELAFEEELIPLVEDIINKRDVSISKYKFQKESYLINNKSVPVNDVIFEIRSMFACWLEAWKVDECYYNIKGEEFHIKDDDVQIINKLINGIDESNVLKYEQKKCVYDISGNECLITNLSSYIVFLLFDKHNFDDKVAAELKEIYLKDKIDRNKKEFVKKTYCFICTLPKPILTVIRKAEKEYNEDSILQNMKNLKSNTDPRFQHITPENFVNILKQMMSFLDSCLELIFEETSEEEMQLLRQILESENTEEICYFIDEETKNERLKFRNKINLDDIYDAIINNMQCSQYTPISEFDLYFIQAVVSVYHEEYEEWKSKAEIEGILNLDYIYEYYFKEGYRNKCFLFYYNFYEGNFFSQLFHAMNYGFIKPEVMKKYIIDRLQELELAKYVQKRYDEYRKVTGGGKDFCFCELEVKDLIMPQTPIIHNENAEKEIFNVLRKPLGMGESGLRYLYKKLYKQFLDAATEESNFITCLGADNNKEHLRKIKWIGKVFELKYFLDILYKDEGYSYIDAAKIFIQKNGKSLSERSLKNDTKNVPKDGVCYMFRRLVKEALEIE